MTNKSECKVADNKARLFDTLKQIVAAPFVVSFLLSMHVIEWASPGFVSRIYNDHYETVIRVDVK